MRLCGMINENKKGGDGMKLIFVRHGDPDYERDSLTEKGFREAQLLVSRFKNEKVTAFYCSPLGRARDTAAPTLAMFNQTAETLDWLEEFDGMIRDPLTGETTYAWRPAPATWMNEKAYYDKDTWGDTPIMQTGNAAERYREVCGKFDEWLRSVGYERDGALYRVTQSNHDTYVFFCHLGIQDVLLSHLFGFSPLAFRQSFLCLPTGVTTVYSEERQKGIARFYCTGFSDVSHLFAAGEIPSQSGRFCETFEDEMRH